VHTLGYIVCRVAISCFFGVCALLWATVVCASLSEKWVRKDWSDLILQLIVGLPMTLAVSGGFLALAIGVWRPMIEGAPAPLFFGVPQRSLG
jgi:hypothetical protein